MKGPWESASIIVIDKGFTEYKVLKEEIPNAIVLYCQSHVIKALFKLISDHDVNKDDRDECRQLILSLLFQAARVSTKDGDRSSLIL